MHKCISAEVSELARSRVYRVGALKAGNGDVMGTSTVEIVL